jgi:hypothetical protein
MMTASLQARRMPGGMNGLEMACALDAGVPDVHGQAVVRLEAQL